MALTGLDGTFSQIVHARHSYLAEEIVWNRRFVEILDMTEDGTRIVDYRRFHDLAAEGE